MIKLSSSFLPSYDFVVVGAGPCGLALVQCLRHTGKSILLLDSQQEIGGCHRVVRVDKYFTEHGPRVYFNNYNNFKLLLRDMGLEFHKLFVPYRYSIMGELLRRMMDLHWKEWVHLSLTFFLFLLDNNYGKRTTVLQFVKKHHFQPRSIQVLDRALRMSDGAGIDRYSLNQFFQMLNQQMCTWIYQPREANDRGLFAKWETFFRKQDNVEVRLGHDVVHLSYDKETNRVQSVWALDKQNHNTIEIRCHHVVLAVPPHAMARILQKCHANLQNSFMPFSRLTRLVRNTEYIPYISLTYHWKTKQKTPGVHGFPVGEWGIIFIVLSDYMDMSQEPSKTLISCCVSYLDKPSLHTEKTANQSSPDEVLKEVFRQLKYVMPSLPEPDMSLVSPLDTKTATGWTQYDVSYVSSIKETPLKNHGRVPNLYNVGTHNGNSEYGLTTMESAVSNAIVLAHHLDPSTKKRYPLQSFLTIQTIMVYILLFLLFLIVVMAIVQKIIHCKNN